MYEKQVYLSVYMPANAIPIDYVCLFCLFGFDEI